jgi:error-prone DNA polymerase
VLVKDAQRHGLRVKPIDIQISDWPCTVEHEPDGSLSLRMGLGYARRLRKQTAEALVDLAVVPLLDHSVVRLPTIR